MFHLNGFRLRSPCPVWTAAGRSTLGPLRADGARRSAGVGGRGGLRCSGGELKADLCQPVV